MYSYKDIQAGIYRRLRKKVVHPVYRTLAKRSNLYAIVEEFKVRAHALGFNKGYKHYAKYYTLYSFIRKHKPQYVLECGSGVTTMVMLQALKENGAGTLISMDESDFYGGTVKKIAKEMFPDASFEMHIVPSVRGVYAGMQGTLYENLPDHPYGLVFVDGPETPDIDLDAFFVLEKNPQTSIIIDVRYATIAALKQKYPQTYLRYLTNLGYLNV